MTDAIPYISQGDNLILLIDNKSHTINKMHMNYIKIVNAIRDSDWDIIKTLVDTKVALSNYTKGNLSIVDGEIFWDGKPFHNALGKRLLRMYSDGFPIDSMLNLMENLLENPSHRAVNELYGFLERNELPLTLDGCFLAYKKVRYASEDIADKNIVTGDLIDCHSGTIRNNIGDVPAMPRNEVNDNAEETCSSGLHFASLSYLSHYGGSNPIMIVKINPKNVVSIPVDYGCQKGRCCEYEVVAFHGNDDRKEAFTEVVEEFQEIATDDDEIFDAGDEVPYTNNVTKQTDDKSSRFSRPGDNA